MTSVQTKPMIETATKIAKELIAFEQHDMAKRTILCLFNFTEGAELLRLIVRDDLAGAGDLVVNTLWDNN